MSASACYICHTPYHVLISLSKTMLESGSVDAFLVDTIPDVDALASRLALAGVFNEVSCVGVGRPFRTSSFYKGLFLDSGIANSVVDEFAKRLREYENRYIYNDISEVGCLMMRHGLQYHLLEDGFDAFKVFDQKSNEFGNKRVRKILNKLFHLPRFLSDTVYCLDVEVNDASGLKTRIDKPVIEKPRREIFSSLSSSQKAKISKVFRIANIGETHGGTLILTSPFLELGYSESRILEYYGRLVSLFESRGLCFIKPHPRDVIDYSSIVGSDRIIDRTAPIEIILMLPSLTFNSVVTYASTSIGALDCIEHRYVTKPDFDIEGAVNLCLEI